MAATDRSMRFFMLLLASNTKPTETGPSSLERLTILCSTSSSKTRNALGARFSTGLSVGSMTVIGTRIILTSSRMLELAAERFSRGRERNLGLVLRNSLRWNSEAEEHREDGRCGENSKDSPHPSCWRICPSGDL